LKICFEKLLIFLAMLQPVENKDSKKITTNIKGEINRLIRSK